MIWGKCCKATYDSRLTQLLGGELSREKVADWAMDYVRNDKIEIVDEIALDLLKVVGGVDLTNTFQDPQTYLYSDRRRHQVMA